MDWRKVTKWILAITAFVWIVYDFIPFFDPAHGDTISEVMLYYALRLFTLPLVFGALCGHFFWPRDGSYPKPKVLIPVLVGVIVLDVIAYRFDIGFLKYLQTFPFVLFFVGFPVGVIFWPQQKSDKLNGDEL